MPVFHRNKFYIPRARNNNKPFCYQFQEQIFLLGQIYYMFSMRNTMIVYSTYNKWLLTNAVDHNYKGL